MRRIVFSIVGSLGDVHPYIAICKALLARGHRAVIATTDRYRGLVEGEGIEYARLRPSENEFGGLESVAQRLFDPVRGPRFLIREMVMPHVRSQFEDIRNACEGASLLVTHPLTVAGPLVAQKLGIPWASSVLAPSGLLSADDRPLLNSAWWAHALRLTGPTGYRTIFRAIESIVKGWEQPLDELRAELGLPHTAHSGLFRGQFSPMLNLALFPAALAPVRGDWPPNTVLTGFPRFDGKPIQGAQREALERFLDGGPAPIVFALGSSVVMIAGTFWEKALEASLRTGRRAILLTGTPLATQLPSSVAAFDYVPYSAIFARSSVVVHQAGIGTLAQALASGRPQLAVPVAFDQPDNARRVVALGVGRSVPMNKVTAVTLARELTHLLETPAYAERAQQVVGSFAEGGSERAADALVAALS